MPAITLDNIKLAQPSQDFPVGEIHPMSEFSDCVAR